MFVIHSCISIVSTEISIIVQYLWMVNRSKHEIKYWIFKLKLDQITLIKCIHCWSNGLSEEERIISQTLWATFTMNSRGEFSCGDHSTLQASTWWWIYEWQSQTDISKIFDERNPPFGFSKSEAFPLHFIKCELVLMWYVSFLWKPQNSKYILTFYLMFCQCLRFSNSIFGLLDRIMEKIGHFLFVLFCNLWKSHFSPKIIQTVLLRLSIESIQFIVVKLCYLSAMFLQLQVQHCIIYCYSEPFDWARPTNWNTVAPRKLKSIGASTHPNSRGILIKLLFSPISLYK